MHSGDVFLVYFSGHGGNRPKEDDPAQAGEFWSLYDGPLYDDEWDEMLRLFEPDVRVLVISDSCWSGGFGPPDRIDPQDMPNIVYSDALLNWCGFPANPRARAVPRRIAEQMFSSATGRITTTREGRSQLPRI